MIFKFILLVPFGKLNNLNDPYFRGVGKKNILTKEKFSLIHKFQSIIYDPQKPFKCEIPYLVYFNQRVCVNVHVSSIL